MAYDADVAPGVVVGVGAGVAPGAVVGVGASVAPGAVVGVTLGVGLGAGVGITVGFCPPSAESQKIIRCCAATFPCSAFTSATVSSSSSQYSVKNKNV